jgi:hypothetical protein
MVSSLSERLSTERGAERLGSAESAAGRALAGNVFNQPSYGTATLSFVLHAIDSAQDRRTSSNGMQANGRRRFTLMRERDFETIAIKGEPHAYVRMVSTHVLEGFLASRDNGGLKLRSGFAFEP